MKRKITAARALFAASLVMLAAILCVAFIKPESRDDAEAQEYAVTDISVADIGALAVTNGSGTFGLMCYGTEVEMIPADAAEVGSVSYSQSEMRSLIYAACHITATRQLSSDTDPKDCGLNAPAATVVLMGNDGSNTRVSILNRNELDGSYYLYSEADGRIYLIPGEEAALFLRSHMDFAAHEVFPSVPAADIQSVSRIEVTRADGSGYTVENESGTFYITAPIYQRVRGSAVYSSLIAALGGLYGDNCLTLSGGLESVDAAITFTVAMNTGGTSYAAAFAQKDGAWLMENSVTGAVYEINADAVNALPTEYTELMQGTPYYYSLGDCRSLLIKTPEHELLFEISGSGEDISAVCGTEALDAQDVIELSKAVNGAELAHPIDGADGESALTLVFTLNTGSRETVEFIPSGSEYAVRINGTANFTASAYSVESIIKSANSYA